MSLFKPDNQDNLVSRAENVANNVMERFEKVVGRLEATVPRPMGAEKVPQMEETEEYLLVVAQSADPVAAGVERIQEWANVYGLPRAQRMWVSYVSRNEARIAKLVKEGVPNPSVSKSDALYQDEDYSALPPPEPDSPAMNELP